MTTPSGERAGPRSIVLLTGAGISAESGIATFRDGGGLWHEHRLEDVATPEAFARDPALVQRFYDERRRQLVSGGVEPNAAHRALARLQAEWPGDVLLVTQNVDDLHERAGSRQPLHMHGQLLEMRCTRSGRVFPIRDDIGPSLRCACCDRTGTLRPNVVWFGEIPQHMAAIERALLRCGLFAAVGTSGHVYPAAGFAALARAAGAHTVELNLEPSQVADDFAEHRHGPASAIVPAWIDELLASTRTRPG